MVGWGRPIWPASKRVSNPPRAVFMGKRQRRREKKRRKVTMHSEIGATQFGPTVTRVSNLQYESDEKSRHERKRRE